MSAEICLKCAKYKQFCMEEMRRMEKELFDFQEICNKQIKEAMEKGKTVKEGLQIEIEALKKEKKRLKKKKDLSENADIASRTSTFYRNKQKLSEAESEIVEKEEDLVERHERILELEREIEEKEEFLKKRSIIVKKKEQDLYDYDEHLVKLSSELDLKKKELEKECQDTHGVKRRETAKLNWDFLRKAFKSKVTYSSGNSSELEIELKETQRNLSEKEEIIQRLTDKVTKLEYSRLQINKRLEQYESKPSIIITSDDKPYTAEEYTYENEAPLVSTTCSLM
ncbi:DgyrCDS2926 [Dimorphilus gyrociliatus]|uniref:DgyrCDS2926 n=1 Tax=Dimorphilus gyrociliatus TaxID=2664684 RepID=A0A7I8VGS7_9ANNE|nr:DgyrCDS2926 [Dimorphilus gyrociliatus]